MKNITDPVEYVVAEALNSANVQFVHETQNKDLCKSLDFYLPDFDVFIECKRFSCDRTANQITGREVILVQGMKAALAFKELVSTVAINFEGRLR